MKIRTCYIDLKTDAYPVMLVRKNAVLLFILFSSLGLPQSAVSQQAELFTIEVQDGQTVRDLALSYLNDADLWPEILRASQIASPKDVQPGVTVRIPLTQVSRANRELAQASDAIQQATQVGARLFASNLITEAIQLQNDALSKRKARQWNESYEAARESVIKAGSAHAQTMNARNQSAEAVLTDRRGSVQSRKSNELIWSPRQFQDVLIEQERVRTLSNSLAEITFRNESKFRLDANTNVIIQTMRVDPLNKEEETRVNLVEGDVYALLRGNGARKKFDLQVGAVQTGGGSNNMWASRSGDETRLANYDVGDLLVSSGGSSISLGQNQGTLIRGRQTPSQPRTLLPQPTLSAPNDDRIIYRDQLDLTWSAIDGAEGYWVEIAFDHGFTRRYLSEWNHPQTQLALTNLEDGQYYWRIAAVDDAGFPGKHSMTFRFTVRKDAYAPYLVWLQPADAVVVRQPDVILTGESEAGLTLTLNNNPVPLQADGAFETTFTLDEGSNTLVLEAVDASGRTSRRSRTLFYRPDTPVDLNFDPSLPRLGPRHFISHSSLFTLTGQTQPDLPIVIRSEQDHEVTRTHADSEGRFRLVLPVEAELQTYLIQVVSTSGYVTEDRIKISLETGRPEIYLERISSSVTSTQEIPVQGRVEKANRLTINGRDVALQAQRFETTVTLASGPNPVQLVAADTTGQVALNAWTITLDQDPPELKGHRVSHDRASGGETLVIEVDVTDASGLQKAAGYELQVGIQVYNGFLRYQTTTQQYRGLIHLPPSASGIVRLISIDVEDYNGHKQTFTFYEN